MARGFKIFTTVFISTLLAIALLIGGVFGISFFGLFGTESFDASMISLNLTSTVYYTDANGVSHELTHLYQSQNRIWADITDIPKYMQDAFVAIEDERFEQHGGVDIPRTAKATFKYIFTGSSSFGGSTITQQLVKNLTNDRDTSPLRKIREMARSIALEREMSKEQILEMYLNTIYLANNCYGVQAAANRYFGKDASELTLAECASIAGITQYPSYYDPLQNPENNIDKQQIVLKKMLELGKITQEEYDAAIAEKLTFGVKGKTDNSPVQSYFVDELINDVVRDLMREKGYSEAVAEQIVYNSGLKIYATIDPNVQEAIEAVYENPASFPNAPGTVKPESAMVIVDNQTGEVKGIVGGIGKKKQNRIFNRATQALRQPGSTMKPLGVYAPAIEKNLISPSSLVLDAPININGWKPTNYYSGYRGTVTVRTALKESMNTPAVRVLEDVGIDYSYKFVTEKLGITTLVEKDTRNGKVFSDKALSSLSLGGVTDGVKPIELAGAYAAFANGGIYHTPHTYTKVVDSEGNILLENKIEGKVAMSDSTAYLVTSMLESVVKNGTGTTARLPCGMPSGGKTGTTDGEIDRWYVGFTPYYTGVVWYGYDNPQSLSFLSYHPCTPVWKNVMNTISASQPRQDFKAPDSVKTVSVCSATGKYPNEECTTVVEHFKSDAAPTAKCNGEHMKPVEDIEDNPEAGGATAETPGSETTPESGQTPSTDPSVPPQSPTEQPTEPPQQPQIPSDVIQIPDGV